MSVNSLVDTDTRLIVDRVAHTIRFVRTFSASRSDIFNAWTQPEQVARWWDPSGAPLEECEIDLRPGGAFKFAARGLQHAFDGIYREIVPPDHLVFDAMGAIGTVALTESGDQTVMTVTIACSSAAHLDQFMAMGVDAGTARTLDNLVVYIRDAGNAART